MRRGGQVLADHVRHVIKLSYLRDDKEHHPDEKGVYLRAYFIFTYFILILFCHYLKYII